MIDARLSSGLNAAVDTIAAHGKLAVLSQPHEPAAAVAHQLLARCRLP